MKDSQLTDTVVMISPDQFGFNPETALTNVFQNKMDLSEKEIRDRAMKEFKKMTEVLESEKIRVLVLKSRSDVVTPDAVFPNNWFSHHHGGKLVLYPMLAKNRRLERQFYNLKNLLHDSGINHIKKVDFSKDEEKGLFLEGTGSLVLDRENRVAFAMESARTMKEEFLKWCREMEYEPVFFHAYDDNNRPVYHTNVVMSIGDDFAVVCLDSIRSEQEKETVKNKLNQLGKEIIEISTSQMFKFCGNILQLISKDGNKKIVMSKTAFDNFNDKQKSFLKKYGGLVVVDIPTIEEVEGGSARCMMAEIF